MNSLINKDYWVQFIDVVANASTCRKKLGAIIVHNKHIIGMGYTGSVHGDDHCDSSGCIYVKNHREFGSGDKLSCIRTIHAEMNAILNIQYPLYTEKKVKLYMACYSTYQPCLNCFKALLQIGVKSFCYKLPYMDVHRNVYIAEISENIKSNIIMEQI